MIFRRPLCGSVSNCFSCLLLITPLALAAASTKSAPPGSGDYDDDKWEAANSVQGCATQETGSEVMGGGSVGACTFPFSYDGTTYKGCTYGGDLGWCAFDSVYQDGRWGYCTEACTDAEPDGSGEYDTDDDKWDPVDLVFIEDEPGSDTLSEKTTPISQEDADTRIGEAATTLFETLGLIMVDLSSESSRFLRDLLTQIFAETEASLVLPGSDVQTVEDFKRKFQGSDSKVVPAIAISVCVSGSTCDGAFTDATATSGCAATKGTMGIKTNDDTALCVTTCTSALTTCESDTLETPSEERDRRSRRSGDVATFTFTMIGEDLDVNAITGAIEAAQAESNGATISFTVTTIAGGVLEVSARVKPVAVHVDLEKLDQADSLASYLSAVIASAVLPLLDEVIEMARSISASIDTTAAPGPTRSDGDGVSDVFIGIMVLGVLVLLVILLYLLWGAHERTRAAAGGTKVAPIKVAPATAGKNLLAPNKVELTVETIQSFMAEQWVGGTGTGAKDAWLPSPPQVHVEVYNDLEALDAVRKARETGTLPRYKTPTPPSSLPNHAGEGSEA